MVVRQALALVLLLLDWLAYGPKQQTLNVNDVPHADLSKAKERDYEELLLLSHDAYHAKARRRSFRLTGWGLGLGC